MMDLRRRALFGASGNEKLWLIKDGNLCKSENDWTKIAENNTFYTFRKMSGAMQFKSWGEHRFGFMISKRSVNIANYNAAVFDIKINVNGGRNTDSLLSFSSDSEGATVTNRFLLLPSISTGINRVDISNLTGEMYPMLAHTSQLTVSSFEIDIYNAWLE